MRLSICKYSSLICVLGCLIGVSIKNGISDFWTDYNLLLMAFFCFVEIATGLIFCNYEERNGELTIQSLNSKRFIAFYATSKFIKLIVTIIYCVLGIRHYANMPDHNAIYFAITVMIIYGYNLAMNTYVVTRYINKAKRS